MALISLDMHYYIQYLIWSITIVVVHSFIKKFLKPVRTLVSEPPSPPALPFIGHLHLVSSVLPKSFQDLAQRYGPLMGIRLGASACLVVSNAAVAKEIFKTQELNFCSRPEFGSSEYFIYRGSRFVLAQYGDYWRFMKKLCMTRLLAVPQLDKFADIRDQEKVKLVESVLKCCKQGKTCDLSSELTTLTNNTICRMAMSTRCSGSDNDAAEIKELIRTCLKLSGKISVGDVLGPLKVLDFSGNGNKLKAALLKYDRLVERIIKEHQDKASGGFDENQKMDLLDILLEVYRDPTVEVKISMKDIKSFLLDIFMAGTDTSSSAMQWAMGELMNNPKAFKKLRDEINSVVGPNRLVKESDIPNLPYLRAVIRETLRLHPSAPLIIRECGEDCNVNGFSVKAKTRVLVNVYAVMRDSDSWAKPNEFDPERFLGGSDEKIGEHQMEFKGQNFRFLPFGSGRRGCPGASLAMLVMHAAVGSLVQCFDWEVKGGEGVDLSPGPGFATEMAHPLVCCPTVRFNPF
ncbi:cytochrome P450, family 712, subfamily A, polypeptide 1 [Hibiscus trionum]|uniref:Cytochrome P450, family 712, subfamily A, polypeptide 1 n=1 Tax=Hibiscus trionum TaxID=183268 RepID=A0A9W7MTC1_HIBTR|nr:cytochrome P450, family 712, subfamily A, polypeptide 1 [Hibiscus trionum]